MSAIITDDAVLELERQRSTLVNILRSKGYITLPSDAEIADMIPLVSELPEKTANTSLINGTITRFVDYENTLICSNLFRGRTSLEYVELGKALTVNGYAFASCGVVTFKLMECTNLSVDYSISSCSNLRYFYAPKMTTYANYAFNSTDNIKHFIAPSLTRTNLDYFGATQLAIADVYSSKINRNCPDLTLLIVRNTSGVVALSNSTYIHQGDPTDVEIYVPQALVDSYKAATNWSVFANCIKSLEGSPYEETDWYESYEVN